MSEPFETDSHARSLDALAEDFAARLRQGGRPSIADYIDRRPDLADAIRSLFPMLEEMEAGAPPREPEAAAPLAELGDCRILREIGRGGMGIVYEAEQLSLGRRVALKILPALFSEPTLRRRFEREARTAARLHHSNIVPVFSVGEHDGAPFYTMQLISGQSLDKVIAELRVLRGLEADDAASTVSARLASGEWGSPTLAVDAAPTTTVRSDSTATQGISAPQTRGGKSTYWHSVARLGVQAADALDYAHRQSVLHRDVKPSNLILDAAGTLWVTDLGLAKDVGQNDLTRTGDVVGTLRYLPPEALSGAVDARSDVYSLGLTLYEMIALRPAFDAVDRAALLRDIANSEPTPLSLCVPNAPRDLAVVVQRAIEREPGRRYATAAEFRADLQRFLDDEPVHARSASAAYRLQKFVRRNRVPVVAAAAVLAALTVGIVGTTVGMLRASERAESERIARLDAQEQRRVAEASAAAEKKANALTVRRLTQIDNGADLLASVFANLNPREVVKEEKPLRELLADQLANAARELDGEAVADAPTVAKLQHILGLSYLNLGFADRAIPLFERAFKARESLAGRDDVDTLTTANGLGDALQQAGKLDLALPLLEDTLRRRVAKLGANHPDSLRSRNNLAMGRYASGDVDGCIPVFAEALKGMREVLGADHPNTVTAEINLASAYSQAGQLALAIPLLAAAHARAKAKYGAEHVDALSAANNLAAAYLAAEKFDLALELAVSTLKSRTKTLGADNAATLGSVNTLATIHFRMGRLSESIPLFEDMLPRVKRVLGPDHPDTLSATANLGVNYAAANRLKDAIPLLEQTVRHVRRLPGLSWAKDSLEECYLRAGRVSDAAAMIVEDVRHARTRPAADGVELKGILARAGDKLISMRAFDAAEPILKDYLAACESDARKKPPECPEWKVAYARSLYGASLIGLKKYDLAEPFVRQGYEGLKRDRTLIPPPARRAALATALSRRMESARGLKRQKEIDELKKEQEWMDRALPPVSGP